MQSSKIKHFLIMCMISNYNWGSIRRVKNTISRGDIIHGYCQGSLKKEFKSTWRWNTEASDQFVERWQQKTRLICNQFV